MVSRLNPKDGELFRIEDEDSRSSSSSSSPPENGHVTLVMDIHELKKGGDKPDNSVLSKVKRLKKKKKSARNHILSNDSSSSPSESTNASKTDTALEKFYDAHGSLHALPENPRDAIQPVEVPATKPPMPDLQLPMPALQPAVQTNIVMAKSEHGPKMAALGSPQCQTQSVTLGQRPLPSKPTPLPDSKRLD